MWSALGSWLHLTFIGKLILNIFTICPLGTLWSHFAKHWKCAQFFTHWAHWSHMLPVLSMCSQCAQWVFGSLSPVSCVHSRPDLDSLRSAGTPTSYLCPTRTPNVTDTTEWSSSHEPFFPFFAPTSFPIHSSFVLGFLIVWLTHNSHAHHYFIRWYHCCVIFVP